MDGQLSYHTQGLQVHSVCILLPVYVFVFNVPSTAKVIWRWGHSLKSHPRNGGGKKVSEYDQEITQSHTTDQPMAP